MLIPLLNVLDLLGQNIMTILLILIVFDAIVIALSPYLIRFKRVEMKEER